jgi:hypothetical protein
VGMISPSKSRSSLSSTLRLSWADFKVIFTRIEYRLVSHFDPEVCCVVRYDVPCCSQVLVSIRSNLLLHDSKGANRVCKKCLSTILIDHVVISVLSNPFKNIGSLVSKLDGYSV